MTSLYQQSKERQQKLSNSTGDDRWNAAFGKFAQESELATGPLQQDNPNQSSSAVPEQDLVSPYEYSNVAVPSNELHANNGNIFFSTTFYERNVYVFTTNHNMPLNLHWKIARLSRAK